MDLTSKTLEDACIQIAFLAPKGSLLADPQEWFNDYTLRHIRYIESYREAILFDFLCSGAFLNELCQGETIGDPMSWRVL